MSIDHHGDDESQTIIWLEHKARTITTGFINDSWIIEWASLIQKYFKNETRNPIRLKIIALISQIFSKYHAVFEDEMMEKIIVPNFNDIYKETDCVVRKPIVHLLFDVASTCLSPEHCITVLTIIKQILFKPFKPQKLGSPKDPEPSNVGGSASSAVKRTSLSSRPSIVYMIGNVDIIDSRLIITNLNKLFCTKLHCLPIEPAVYMLGIAVDYLELIFKYPVENPIPAELPMVRKELFSFFLNLRCNKHGHLGVQQSHQSLTQIAYSPFIICVKKPRANDNLRSTSTNNSSLENMSFSDDDDVDQGDNEREKEVGDNRKSHNVLDSEVHLLPIDGSLAEINDLASSITVPTSDYYQNCPPVSRCVTLDNMLVGIVNCIQQETDSDVLISVLSQLPNLLANKPFILKATNERINQLCLALSDLTRSTKTSSIPSAQSNLRSQHQSSQINPNQPQSHHSSQTNPASMTANIDIVRCSIDCLTSLPIYKSCLDHRTIKHMLAAFEESLKVSRNQIVPTLTNCLIELQDSPEMTKFLPVVLNRLSKFSPTLNLGISILEFLSYLILFPKLYENFSGDEYKYIFAIALPYTNPFRFTDYITCLAFRTIAMWYLNCRPSLRCAFVEFVKKSLQSNVIQPFKENSTPSSSMIYSTNQQQQNHHHHYHHYQHHNHHSLTSSPITTPNTPTIMHSCPPTVSSADQRRRSASFNTENSFRLQHYQSTGNTPNSQYQHNLQQSSQHHIPQSSQSSLQLNEELIETFADLLSRYMHGQCLANAPKNKHIDSLIDRSTSQTWLHGNALITITSDSSGQGWAEIFIRRPTGNTCWLGRLQNTQSSNNTMPQANQQQVYLDSLNFSNDVISLFKTMSLTQLEKQQTDQQQPSNETDNQSNNTTSASTNVSASSQPTSVASSVASLLTSIGAGSGSVGGNTGTGSSNHVAPLTSSSSNNLQSPNQQNQTCKQVSRDPIPLPKDKRFDIALSNFDHITPYETHKVGVVYVGPRQVNNRASILANRCGSPRYLEFLSNMGTCIVLSDIDPEIYFIGGLDTKGEDGKYAYFWKDNVTQVIFHVATFMPFRESDPQCNNKNRHIGNDHVCIIYNDSDEAFQMSTIKGTGQLISACIVISPLDSSTNCVEVEVLPGLKEIIRDAQHILEPKILSNLGASLYARQVAIDLNLVSKIHERHAFGQTKEPYVSNWVERLRCIKRIRQRLDENRRISSGANSLGRSNKPIKTT